MALLRLNLNRPTLFIFAFLLFATGLWAQPARIAQAIDDSATVQLPGQVSPKAHAQWDQGPVEPSFPMQYLTLLLQPSKDQKASLAQLLADQQERSSAKYHHWLTPELYADSFGLNPVDMSRIVSWLQVEGFTVNYQARGRNWIAFSGDAAKIQHIFHTEIHQYTIDGEKHFANATNPSIPAAFAGIVTGIRGLDDFRPKPAYTKGKSVQRSGMRPDYTMGGSHYLAPGDIATIYDLNALYSSKIDGTAQTVVVVGQSDFYATDISDFRSAFGLPNQPIQSPPCAANALCMILYGTDPGYSDPGSLDEAELDLEWAGAVARNAAIYYVNSTNVTNSVQYAIDNDLGPVISMSYGACEQAEPETFLDSERSLAQEANSFGITWVAASGDAGAADCDWDGSSTGSQATQGLAVEFPASIPEVTGVGGTEFNEGGGTYWNSSNGANGGSALSYIPEMGWNDTVYGTGLSSTIAASGGGVSMYYPTPAWQAGPGFPNDGFRDVPDVSMTASAAHDGYLTCMLDTQGCTDDIYGGTSAATPVFAGMLALVNQYLLNKGVQSQAGLGNINPTLYALYQSNPGAFHDITTGSNVVPCQIGTPDCTTGSFGYYAQAGYDQVTGLGSIDGYNLVVAWAAAPQKPQLSITKSDSVNFTQGQDGATYSVTVANAGSGPTSGTVSVTETVPSSLTLVSMSGSGSSGASTWSCTGSTCTTSNVLNPGWSYPPIIVTVNVALSAPGQVTNQVNVSGGGSAAANASDVITIQPILGGDLMSKSSPSGTGCTAPPPASAFLTTDTKAVVWFEINYWNAGDQATLNWYAPNGSLYEGVPFPLSAYEGSSGCFWDSINIAGNPPASEPGNWSVTLIWDNSLLFTLPFTIQSGPTNTISGQVTLSGSGLSGVTVTLGGSQSNSATTNGSGNYSFTVPAGGNYTVTPSLAGYTFNPSSLSFNNLSGNQTSANFVASTVTYTISGQVTLSGSGLGGVTVALGGSQSNSATTNGSGNYSFTVPAGGNYTVTPSLSGYTFNPASLSFNNLSGNQTASFVAILVVSTYTISGQVTLSGNGLGGVTVTLSGSQSGSAATNGSGNYSFTVPAGGTYTITPSATGYSFSPPSQTFTNLSANQTASFTAATCALSVNPTAVFLDSTSQSGPPLSVATGPACSWVASANAAFIGITSGASGSGNGTVVFSVPANTTGADRTGTLSVNSQPVSITQRETANIFSDVPPSNGFFDFINTMYERGITAGCAASPLQYCPNSTTTRAEMAVFIITGIEGGETFSYTTTPYFTDVPSTDPFFKFVQKMKDLGITSGCSATMYCPNDPVTRGEMAVFIILGRYGTIDFSALPGYSATQIFSDVPPSSPFYAFIQEMAEAGITGGCGSGMYCPNASLTRGQMAVFMVTGLLNQLLPAATPVIATAVPNAAAPGQAVTLALGGVNTHFVQGATQVTMAPGITPTGIVVSSATSLTVQIAVGSGVVPGPTSIVVTTGTEEAVLPNGFTVQ
jgi:hypothetical protein